jgi:site-specific DNA-cytosine methylase
MTELSKYSTNQQSPINYQTPPSFSDQKIFALLGNSIQVSCTRYFLAQNLHRSNIKFLDLFAGIGGFHLAVTDYGTNSNKCVLATDNNKDCQVVYQLNFPNTPFLLGDINDKEIQKQIINIDFDLLCAGFPCQPYSRANTSKNKKDTVIGSLLEIIEKKRPQYLFLENVPQLLNYPIFKEIKE